MEIIHYNMIKIWHSHSIAETDKAEKTVNKKLKQGWLIEGFQSHARGIKITMIREKWGTAK